MQTSILLAAHRSAGAEFASGVEPPLLLTFDDVPAEYAAGTESAALFDQTDRGRVRVTGEDRAAFLHRLLANSVRTLEPGQGNANLLLTAKGKIVEAFDLSVEPDSILLSTAPGRAAQLVTALDMYHFSEAVELEDATEQSAPLALCGPHTAQLVTSVTDTDPEFLAQLPDHETLHTTATLAGGSVALSITPLPVAGSPGLRLDAGPEHAATLWSALVAAGARPAGRIAWDCLRVEAGAAEAGVDVDDSIYPQEARWEAAFSLDKGCYIGQEVVAKIDTYGGLNKRLMALAVEHDDPVPAGTRLMRRDADEWRDLGIVTSWAYSFVLDTGLVLAYVKRKHQDPGTTFRLGESEASAKIVELPIRAGAVPQPCAD